MSMESYGLNLCVLPVALPLATALQCSDCTSWHHCYLLPYDVIPAPHQTNLA
jgi:hypothetical protein